MSKEMKRSITAATTAATTIQATTAVVEEVGVKGVAIGVVE